VTVPPPMLPPTEARHSVYDDIFAAEHGSWNKATPGGYEVVRVPLTKGHSSGEYEDFLTGFITGNGDAACGRPVGVAVASDGSLQVTDDASKSIWRVRVRGQIGWDRRTQIQSTRSPTLGSSEP